MIRPCSNPTHASVDEVAQALEGLSSADLARLRQLAKLRSATLVVMDWEDLLNEALKRALDGTRLWPREVPLMAFLAQTMRSIASEEHREGFLAPTISEAELVGSSGQAMALGDLVVDEVEPSRVLQARRAIERIESQFADDEQALAALRGLAIGSTPDEIQQASGMSATQYASTLRRIRRTLARI